MAAIPPRIQALAEARTLLFVPGDRPERHAKALGAGADGVIIDLEDAVAPAAKAAAAEALRATWPALAATPGRPPLVLRCNAAGTPWFEADLALAAALRPDALLLPKAESPEQLAACAARLALDPAAGAEGSPCAGAPRTAGATEGGGVGGPDQPAIALLPLIETAAGLAAVRPIAASGQVLRLILGHLDLQADLGLACSDDERELDAVRFELVLASRLAGLPAPLDGVTVATDDAARLAADTERARRFGFTGKLCIHPRQVAGVHAGFAPGAERLAWARRVLDAVAAMPNGAEAVDGKMVDAPVIKLAQQVLAAARA